MINKGKPKGLGFLEVIIALSVMIVGVTSGLTLTTFNLANIVIAENQVLATGLAREPIEIVRGWRDSNWLDGRSWNNMTDHGEYSTLLQYFDKNDSSLKFTWTQDADLDSCEKCNIVYDKSVSMYLQSIDSEGSEPLKDLPKTSFKRWTKVNNICWNVSLEKQYIADYGVTCGDDTEVGWRLTTEVNWYDNQNKKTLAVSEDLYDWR